MQTVACQARQVLLCTASPLCNFCPMSVPSRRPPVIFSQTSFWPRDTPTLYFRSRAYSKQPTVCLGICYQRLRSSMACCLSLVPLFRLLHLWQPWKRFTACGASHIVFHHHCCDFVVLKTFPWHCPLHMNVEVLTTQPNCGVRHLEQSSTPPCSRPCQRPCRLYGTLHVPVCLPTSFDLLPFYFFLRTSGTVHRTLVHFGRSPVEADPQLLGAPLFCCTSKSNFTFTCIGLQTPPFQPNRLGQCPKPSTHALSSFFLPP